MEQFYVTKKQYDWVVRHNDEEFGLSEDCDDAIVQAQRKARQVIADGGEAEVLVANIYGKWDTVPFG